jgi:hypothetical protein
MSDICHLVLASSNVCLVGSLPLTLPSPHQHPSPFATPTEPLNGLSRRSYGAVDGRLSGQGRVIDFASGLRMCVRTSAWQGLSVMLESTLWANGRPTAHIAAFSLLLWKRLWKKQLSLAPYWSMLNIGGEKLQPAE